MHSKACNTFSCRAQAGSEPVLARGGRHPGRGSGLGLDDIAPDGAAPSLAGSHSGGPARVCCGRGGSRDYRLRPGAAAPGTSPCSAGPQIIAAGIPRLPEVPDPATRSCRAESGTAPPCMRWRGRARPHRAGWPVAWSSPRAARRPPGPGTRARGRSPGSSHVPGVAPGWCPFPAVKALLLPPQAPRKTLRPAISCFPLSTKESTESRQLSAFHSGYPRVYSQPAHKLPGVSRRTPELLSLHAIGRSFHSDFRVVSGNRIRCGHRWLTIRLCGRRACMNHLRRPSPIRGPRRPRQMRRTHRHITAIEDLSAQAVIGAFNGTTGRRLIW